MKVSIRFKTRLYVTDPERAFRQLVSIQQELLGLCKALSPLEKEANFWVMPMADDEGVIATAEADSLATPLLRPTAIGRDPFVEVRLYRRGAGPVALFRSRLTGPRRDRLDVRRIQAEHGLRALFAYKPGESRRGLRIRADPAAGYSALPFRDGAVIFLDGEPKESWTKPASLIVAGLLVPVVMVTVAVKGVPEPLRSSRLVNAIFPPWILVGAVIIFARVRTRPRTS